jgi:signal transduction histidine kinase/ligand-binding sensor protein
MYKDSSMIDDNNKQQQVSCELWPMHPTFISKVLCCPEIYSPNEYGLFEADTLRGFIADASDSSYIENTLSLFQVVPSRLGNKEFFGGRTEVINTNNKFLQEILAGRKIIRIDPNGLYPISKCCKYFRQTYQGEPYCFELDSRIAVLYHESLLPHHIIDNFDQYEVQLKNICQQFNKREKETANSISDEDLLVVEKYRYKESNRLYIKYRCCYSGFYEYFFPIQYLGKVVAVLMHGQVIEQEMTRTNIFKNYPNTRDEITDEEFNEHRSSMDNYRLNAVAERIETLEKRIDKEVLFCANNFVLDKFKTEEQRFDFEIESKIFQNARNQKANMPLSEHDFHSIFNGSLQYICEIFNADGFIRIYAQCNPMEEIHSKQTTFNLIGSSKDDGSYLKFVFKELPDELTEGVEIKELLSSLQSSVLADNDIFCIQNLLLGRMRVLIWEQYSDWRKIYPGQFKIYSDRLMSAYKAFMEPYNVLQRIQTEQKLEAAIRTSKHEMAQIIPVVVSSLSRTFNLSNVEHVEYLNGARRVVFDVIQRIKLLDELSERVSLLYKKSNDDLMWRWHDIHRMVYAMKTLYDEKAREDNMQYIIINSWNFSYNCYELYTDINYFNHIISNLIDNAIKYGLRGSKIWINLYYSSPYVPDQRFYISVVSYGKPIGEDERQHLFELFYRAPDKREEKEGMGIGLFLAKRMSEMLGYEIVCRSSEWIANKNLPLEYHYAIQKGEKITDLSRELSEVVNAERDNSWKISEGEYKYSLNEPTYRNELVITLINKNNDINFLRNKRL